MAKVTITITDTEYSAPKGRSILDVKVEFDPPAKAKKKPTPAQSYGLALLSKIKSDA